jgi:hypothetical protein
MNDMTPSLILVFTGEVGDHLDVIDPNDTATREKYLRDANETVHNIIDQDDASLIDQFWARWFDTVGYVS